MFSFCFFDRAATMPAHIWVSKTVSQAGQKIPPHKPHMASPRLYAGTSQMPEYYGVLTCKHPSKSVESVPLYARTAQKPFGKSRKEMARRLLREFCAGEPRAFPLAAASV
jgi:hypothetical protein